MSIPAVKAPELKRLAGPGFPWLPVALVAGPVVYLIPITGAVLAIAALATPINQGVTANAPAAITQPINQPTQAQVAAQAPAVAPAPATTSTLIPAYATYPAPAPAPTTAPVQQLKHTVLRSWGSSGGTCQLVLVDKGAARADVARLMDSMWKPGAETYLIVVDDLEAAYAFEKTVNKDFKLSEKDSLPEFVAKHLVVLVYGDGEAQWGPGY
jgi:hypothetical protein